MPTADGLGRLGAGFILIALTVLWGSGSVALGAGFALVQQGTAAMAQGNAFVAQADDASAIFYNPAGLSQLKRPQFYSGLFLNYPDREFNDAGFSQTNHRLYHAAAVYLTAPINGRVTLGIGFFSPFGLGTVWPPTWTGRYITTFSDLKTYNLNPVISVKPMENLSLAAGLDVLWSSVHLKRKVPVAVKQLQFPDGEADLQGDAAGFGYNLGVLYEPVAGVKLGVSYRSDITVTHHGHLATTLPLNVPALLAPMSATIAGTAGFTFPPSVTFGISLSPLQSFALEFDTTWTGWSTYDRLQVNLSRPIIVNGVLTDKLVTPKNWQDAWAFRFGVNYQVSKNMKLRAGYIYDLTPVPDDTFDPQVPDANRHIFTVGGDLKYQRFTLGIAYNYILNESRIKNNVLTSNGVAYPPAFQANGRYHSDVHSLGLSFAFQF